jgi:hypothetical protein
MAVYWLIGTSAWTWNMAYTAKFVRQRLAADAEYERELVAIKRVKDWRAVAWEWHTKQTARAVFFPSYGWAPKVAIAGRAPDGLIVPWVQFRNGYHQFLLAGWFLDKKESSK